MLLGWPTRCAKSIFLEVKVIEWNRVSSSTHISIRHQWASTHICHIFDLEITPSRSSKVKCVHGFWRYDIVLKIVFHGNHMLISHHSAAIYVSQTDNDDNRQHSANWPYSRDSREISRTRQRLQTVAAAAMAAAVLIVHDIFICQFYHAYLEKRSISFVYAENIVNGRNIS